MWKGEATGSQQDKLEGPPRAVANMATTATLSDVPGWTPCQHPHIVRSLMTQSSGTVQARGSAVQSDTSSKAAVRSMALTLGTLCELVIQDHESPLLM